MDLDTFFIKYFGMCDSVWLCVWLSVCFLLVYMPIYQHYYHHHTNSKNICIELIIENILKPDHILDLDWSCIQNNMKNNINVVFKAFQRHWVSTAIQRLMSRRSVIFLPWQFLWMEDETVTLLQLAKLCYFQGLKLFLYYSIECESR